MSNILDSKYSDYLTALDTVGITNTTDILATSAKMYNAFTGALDNGKTKEERDPRFIRWKEENRLIPVCPEVDGGLPEPRTDAQRIGDQVITRDGRDVTKEYRRGAEIALERALQEEVLCAVLKEKSPSCGSNKVYDGTFEGKLIDGKG